MTAPSYRKAVEWIALNDAQARDPAPLLVSSTSVLLVAELFGVEAFQVAGDVLRYCRTHGVRFVKRRRPRPPISGGPV